MSAPHVEVHPIPPGSLIVLHGMDVDPEAYPPLIAAIANAAGHKQFCLLECDNAGEGVMVLGPDDDVAAAVAGLLEQARITTATPPFPLDPAVPEDLPEPEGAIAP